MTADASQSLFRVTNPNHTLVYRVAGRATEADGAAEDGVAPLALPHFLGTASSVAAAAANSSKRRHKRLGMNKTPENEIQFIQDFGFPDCAFRLRLTPDGTHAVATGAYKPQLRVWDFSEMSLKFERHTDAENIDFVLLGSDWRKSAHLQADRTIQFHSQAALHYTLRIPREGRQLAYVPQSCDLLVAANSPELFRVNLEHGKFLEPLEGESPSYSALDASSASRLLAAAGDDGFIELWDLRTRERVARAAASSSNVPLSSVSFAPTALEIAVGNRQGKAMVFDLRSRCDRPLAMRDHMHNLPVQCLRWHVGNAGKHLVSADTRSVRIWDVEDPSAKLLCTLEPGAKINDIALSSSSAAITSHLQNPAATPVYDAGVVFVACDDPNLNAFLVPALGSAPPFCAFLDTVTEDSYGQDSEAKDQSASSYEGYKFITVPELKKLNIEYLIGTPEARAYMHGYFISKDVYDRARLVANPFEYEEYRARLAREKLEAARASRIVSSVKKQAPSSHVETKQQETVLYNKNLADRVGGVAKIDSRFQSVFKDADFDIDETSEAFKQRHPTLAARAKAKGGKKRPRRHHGMDSSDEEALQ